MIERLVFISTMVLFLMIGINGFISMGNLLCNADGTRFTITGSSASACGTYDPNQGGLGLSNFVNDANSIQPTGTDANASSSTTAPGSASSVINFLYGGASAAFLGIAWLITLPIATWQLGLLFSTLIPALSPIILIFAGVISALEGFALMYWTMAGARALLGRFL